MPKNWPGLGLEQGLRDEHLFPNCNVNSIPLFSNTDKHYKLGKNYQGEDRNEWGLRINEHGSPCDKFYRGERKWAYFVKFHHVSHIV